MRIDRTASPIKMGSFSTREKGKETASLLLFCMYGHGRRIGGRGNTLKCLARKRKKWAFQHLFSAAVEKEGGDKN